MLPPGEDFRHLPSRMTVQTYFPDAELTSGVESFLIVRSEEGMVRTMPPNAAPEARGRLEAISEALAEQLLSHLEYEESQLVAVLDASPGLRTP
jgi:hypothetical protein